jgi:hypothetical protein
VFSKNILEYKKVKPLRKIKARVLSIGLIKIPEKRYVRN